MKQSFRKKLYFISITVLAFLITATKEQKQNIVIEEITKLSPTVVSKILTPKSISELQEIVESAELPISVAGARCSQGGQIAYKDGLVIDITKLDKVLQIDAVEKTVTVESGITWRKLIETIDNLDLSISSMQSYSDFTIGGSISVNVHGRSVHHDPLINTIISLKIVNAKGELIEASREKNSDYFYAVIGGYGLVGIIAEATLKLTDNVKIESNIKTLKTSEYVDHFYNDVLTDNDLRLHSAYLCPVSFDKVVSVTWSKTDKELTRSSKLRNKDYLLDKLSVNMAHYSLLKRLRSKLAPYTRKKSSVVYQNYEMSDKIKALNPILPTSKVSILQEYFIPTENFEKFAYALKDVVAKHNVKLLNAGIRHVSADTESMLPYAPKEAFAFVLYIDVPKNGDQDINARWTRDLVDAALELNGRYYLPYHLYPTKEQLYQAYPEMDKFLDFKRQVDPDCKFKNELYRKYLEQ